MSDDKRSNVILLPLFRVGTPPPAPPQQIIENEKDRLFIPNAADLEPAIEALLFASEKVVQVEQLNNWLGKPGKKKIDKCLRDIQDRLEFENRGIRLFNIARGWQLRTAPTYSKYVQQMQLGKATKLSKAALETLAIIAYRQPVTRAGIDSFRGVDSGAVLRVLLQHSLVEVVGRKKEVGNPLVYGTTDEFLSMFNLQDLADLPTLKDLRDFEDDPTSFGSPPKD